MERLTSAPIRTTVGVVDKRSWDGSYLALTSGPERILDAIGSLIRLLPDEVVCGQRLLVDMNRGDRGFVQDLKRTVRTANRVAGRPNFGEVAPRPDHGSDALLVQMADIYAGYVRAECGKCSAVEIRNVNLMEL